MNTQDSNGNPDTGPPPVTACRVGPLSLGGDQLVLVAGPCVMESRQLTIDIACQLADICQECQIPLIFKASFDKANRTSVESFRGVGLQEGIDILGHVRQQLSIPVTTDIHEPAQAAVAATVCELLQIPAFLARQTDLLLAAAETGQAVNVKKGQFMAPGDMQFVVSKLRSGGCQNIALTERGTFFGYGRLVNDFTGLVAMRTLGVPVIFDATHSVQQPGGTVTGGNREMVAPLARAAAATGIDALFMETHPRPDQSPSDAANIFPLDRIRQLIREVLAIDQVVRTRAEVPLQSLSNPAE